MQSHAVKNTVNETRVHYKLQLRDVKCGKKRAQPARMRNNARQYSRSPWSNSNKYQRFLFTFHFNLAWISVNFGAYHMHCSHCFIYWFGRAPVQLHFGNWKTRKSTRQRGTRKLTSVALCCRKILAASLSHCMRPAASLPIKIPSQIYWAQCASLHCARMPHTECLCEAFFITKLLCAPAYKHT